MDIQISIFDLSQLFKAAAELGASRALARSGKVKPYITKADAFRKYGRAKVERWIRSGLVTPRKDGNYSSCWRIDSVELESISKSLLILPLIKYL